MIKTKSLSGIFIALSLALASGCNQDAFVERLNPSAKEFAVSEDGDSLKVRFDNEDWCVSDIIIDGKSLGWLARGEGTTTGKDGRVMVKAERLTMFYKHSGQNELTVYFQPNFSSEKIEVEIIVSDPFEWESLRFTQNGGVEYELEKMEWGEEAKRTLPNIKKGWSGLSYKNPGPDTLRVKEAVFSGASRRVCFSDEVRFGDFCGAFEVPVPDGALDNNTLCFNDEERLVYSYDSIEYPISNNTSVVMRFPPTNEFSWFYGVLWYIDTYTVDYKITLRNKETGGLVEFNGTFTSECPNGEYTFFVEKDR